MANLLHIKMESSDINEEWVRANFNLSKERKTTTKSIGSTMDVDDFAYDFHPVGYDRFFDILKNQVDAHILKLIVNNNITCAEKFIKIELEMSTSNWYGDSDPSIYINVEWRHRETNAEVIKRLITTNKRALTALKRKTKKKVALVDKINKLPEAERKELLAQIS